MKARSVVISLGLVLALALAIPALGVPFHGHAGASRSLRSTLRKLTRKAGEVQQAAQAAQSTAGAASAASQGALTRARTARGTADSAGRAAESALSAAGQTLKQVTEVKGKFVNNPLLFPAEATAMCPEGEVVLGGGYAIAGEGHQMAVIFRNAPLANRGWIVLAKQGLSDPFNHNWFIRAVAICAETAEAA